MLIITRRVGEVFYVGDTITVTVLNARGNQVRLGVSAPREVVIDREEVRVRKQQEVRHQVSMHAECVQLGAKSA